MAHSKKLPFKLKHLLTHVALSLFRPIGWLPYRVNLSIGRWVGRRMQRHGGKLGRYCETNIRWCFPHLSEAEQKNLVAKSFEAAGQGFIECAMVAWPREKALLKRIHSFEGLEHLTNVPQQGHGLLVLFPHLSALYMAAYLIQRKTGLDFSLMYHSPRNVTLDHFMRSRLEKYADEVFTRRDLKKMFRALNAKKIVWYAADIDAGAKVSVFAPFFGISAATVTTPMRLAEATGAKVCLSSFIRRDDGHGYDIKILPPFEHFPSGDDVADAARINRAVEDIVKASPHQYLWTMKRFDTRPDGGRGYR
jgi:KDO2-lipid IV(A) lauroyltransferase